MRRIPLNVEGLRLAIRQNGFSVKVLASHLHVDVRTLERRFNDQFQTTPKAWMIRERMKFAPALLSKGLSNKEAAAALGYSCESNFCRDFKRYYGTAPQASLASTRTDERNFGVSRFDNELSRFD